MKGQVTAINPRNGMVAILTETGGYTLIDPLGGEFELGDQVGWTEHYPLGGDSITNITRSERMDVYFENHDVPSAQLRRQMGG